MTSKTNPSSNRIALSLPYLWNLGFRPFFLLSALFAIFSISIWVCIYSGISLSFGSFNPIYWHAHEMIYGYTTAVIAGFVLTASQNWTGLPGLRGRKLQALVAIWLLARILMVLPLNPHPAISLIDLAFYPCLALFMLPYLKPADMKIERVFFIYFLLYFSGNLLMHLDVLGIYSGFALQGAHLGVNTTILMIIFMGGRVIPFFAGSERSKKQPRTYAVIEVLSHITAWGFVISELFYLNSIVSAACAIAAGTIHLLRLGGWYVKRVRRVPLLWVLYIAYLWIVIGFFLSALTSLGIIAIAPAIHAFTIGGIGAITYGMMTRVALGHTGRKLIPHKSIVLGYVLLNLACVLRVFGPIFLPLMSNYWIIVSGTMWITAFATFILVYAPMFIKPRVDGRPG